MAIHILGNGPSIRLFNRDDWPETDVFVGCNLSDPSFRPHFTSVVDIAAIKVILKGYEPAAPLLLSSRAADQADKIDENWRDKTVGIEAVMDLVKDRTVSRSLSMNSAQHATTYSILAYSDHVDVHLFGIDSFWSTNLKSKTDIYVRPNQKSPRVRPQITRQWNGYWHKIFSENTNHNFVIHKPTTTRLVDQFDGYDNLQVVEEDGLHGSQNCV